MHEASLVRSLLNQVAQLAQNQGGGKVSEIRVELGPLSGVEPLLVASAFDQLAPASELAGARLVLDEVPLVAQCPKCGEFTVERYDFRCPICGATQVTVVRGDEFRIVSFNLVEFPEPIDAP